MIRRPPRSTLSSSSAASDVYKRQVGPWARGATCSSVVEDDAVAAVGVGPGDGTLVVADHVAGPTLETLLVVEEDAAVGRGREEVGRAGRDAAPGGARPADVGVHSDVRPLADAKVDAGHALLEGDAAPGQSLRRRGVPAERQRSVRRTDPIVGRSRSAHPKILRPRSVSAASSRSFTPCLAAAALVIRRPPALGEGLVTVNIPSARSHRRPG